MGGRALSRNHILLGGLAVALVAATVHADTGGPESEAKQYAADPHWRHPAAASLLEESRLLVAANERSGSLTLIEVDSSSVLGEFRIGRRLTDVAALPQDRVLAVDRGAGELLLVSIARDRIRVVSKLALGRSPLRVATDPSGTRIGVSNLWDRRVEIVRIEIGADDKPHLQKTGAIELPFSPREQLFLPGGELLVADAFGGRLAVIDVEQGGIQSEHEIDAQNIGDLALSRDGERLLLTHQTLDRGAPTALEHMQAGQLVGHFVRSLPLEALRRSTGSLEEESRLTALHGLGRGAGDPAGLALDSAGRMLVALAGVHEAAIVSPDEERLGAPLVRRVAVGRRPTEVVLSSDQVRAFVVNTFSDSVTILDTQKAEAVAEISLGPTPEPGLRERGERLFFDAELSTGGWLSCHSCHSDGHSTGLLSDTKGDGNYGAPKRILSLLGVGETDNWAWNGEMKELHSQVQLSLETTMHAPSFEPRQVQELVAFLHTLPHAPPVAPQPDSPADAKRLARGRALFEEQGCGKCHVPPLTYTTQGRFDVGVQDEHGRRKFNPPSLRGVSQRERLFHDGRAASLEEVFAVYGHQLEEPLSAEEIADLARFLRSL